MYEDSREGTWVVAGQVVAVLGSLVGVRVLTAVLVPEAYGELALGMTVALLVGQLLFGPLASGATRFLAPALEKDDSSGYLRAVRQLAWWAAGFVGATALIAAVGLGLWRRSEWVNLTLAAFLFGVLAGYNSVLNGIQNAARQRSVVALHQGIAAWARFATAACFVLLLGASGTSALLGYSAATALILLSQNWWVRRAVPRTESDSRTERRWKAQILRFSTPFGLWGVFTWMQFASARWSLAYFGTVDDVGLYSVLYQLGYFPMSLATTMAVQFIAPIVFQRSGDGREPERTASAIHLGTRLVVLTLGMTALAVAIALLIHEQIFALLVSEQYRGVSYLLPWVLLAGGLFAAAQIFTLNQMSQLETPRLIAPKITTAVMGTVLNVVGAYLYGVPGIVVASVLFSGSYFLWMLAISWSAIRRYP